MSVIDELELRFDRNVPPALVHKRAVEQVLLTDSGRRADDEFVCAAQLPRAHAFYNDTLVPVYDAVLLLEVMRQSVELLAHRHLGVPDGQAFILRSIELDVEDVAATRVGPAPAHVVVEETIRDRGYVADDLARLELAGVLHLDGRRFASATGSCLFLSPRDYAEIRGASSRAPAHLSSRAPAAPALVGRRDPRNVTISEPVASDGDARAFEVLVDRDHSTFFDHPLDHVPGMLMVEAARQAALAAASPVGDPPGVVVGVDAAFPGFAEFDEALVCSASPERRPEADDRIDVSVEFEQNGKPTARLGVAVAFPRDQAADGTFERRRSSA